MPAAEPVAYQPNSLFSHQAKGFFKDQRAHQIGDILTVDGDHRRQAKIANQTARKRSSTSASRRRRRARLALRRQVAPADVERRCRRHDQFRHRRWRRRLVNRSESLETQVAVVVTQVLPNGNLVIEGHQEVRVNFEVRDLIVAGIVRPEDIGNDNTIDSTKIAEARISYGGRGQITDVQQPRYGQQIARRDPAVLALTSPLV